MNERVRDKDVLALRTAVVCVGLSGVFLGAFVWLASKEATPWAAVISSAATGLVVAAVGLFNAPAARLSRPGRMLAYWVLAAVLVLELMIPLNYVGIQRHAKWDWTESKLRSLSEMTDKVLGRVDKPLHVSTFFFQQDPQQRAAFTIVKDLLEEYRQRNPNLVVDNIDPSRDTDKMFAAAKRLNIEDPRELMQLVVFEYEKGRKDVPVQSLFSMMPGEVPSEEMHPDQWGFVGEQMFTSAILDLTETHRKELWFLTSHGELSPDEELNDIASALKRMSYQVRTFDTLADGVPDNCSVLVILRPKPAMPFNDRELNSLGRYLGEGGKLFLGVNGGGSCGFEPILGDFGIQIGRNYIVDQTSGNAELSLVVRVSGWHEEIARNLRQYPLYFTPPARSRPPGCCRAPSPRPGARPTTSSRPGPVAGPPATSRRSRRAGSSGSTRRRTARACSTWRPITRTRTVMRRARPCPRASPGRASSPSARGTSRSRPSTIGHTCPTCSSSSTPSTGWRSGSTSSPFRRRNSTTVR